ncbi:hypothetical protein [Streptomyces sp. NPDC058678]|uniref:hypothetical protein n=1 Tax=Streptomyces sp. NPDC058678 TaxID=3346595 RepID=UPI003659AA08
MCRTRGGWTSSPSPCGVALVGGEYRAQDGGWGRTTEYVDYGFAVDAAAVAPGGSAGSEPSGGREDGAPVSGGLAATGSSSVLSAIAVGAGARAAGPQGAAPRELRTQFAGHEWATAVMAVGFGAVFLGRRRKASRRATCGQVTTPSPEGAVGSASRAAAEVMTGNRGRVQGWRGCFEGYFVL